MNNWLDYVECTKLKAFVEVISASSVRAGSQYFMMVYSSIWYNIIIIISP
eukprot:m.98066 g.98066  ORF g.98066 m.98066 type:complete len:50 (+) comp36969_c0_seq36:1864-2013(+)